MYVLIQSYLPLTDLDLVLQITGVIGFLFYVGGFAALQLGKLDGNGRGYVLTNVVGATLVLISLIGAFNLASLLIQISWIAIGCCGLYRISKQQPKQRTLFKTGRRFDPQK